MTLNDLEAARRSRNKNRKETDSYYDRQAQVLKGGEAGGCCLPLPKELRLRNLPQGELRFGENNEYNEG